MVTNGSIKVFLADDSQQIRQRVNALLAAEHMDIVGEGGTPAIASRLARFASTEGIERRRRRV